MNRYLFQINEDFGSKITSNATEEKDDFLQSIMYHSIDEAELSSNIERQQYKCKPNDTLDEIKINQYGTRLQKKEMLSRGDAFDKSSEDLSELHITEQKQVSERYKLKNLEVEIKSLYKNVFQSTIMKEH